MAWKMVRLRTSILGFWNYMNYHWYMQFFVSFPFPHFESRTSELCRMCAKAPSEFFGMTPPYQRGKHTKQLWNITILKFGSTSSMCHFLCRFFLSLPEGNVALSRNSQNILKHFSNTPRISKRGFEKWLSILQEGASNFFHYNDSCILNQ